MLLPGDSRLAGIFPKSRSLIFNSSNKRNRHEKMQQHASKLVMDHNLFTGKSKNKTGILPGSRNGCICIMYIKEGHMKDRTGATFRPIFGASGVSPYGERHHLTESQINSNSYISMGVPDPSPVSDISYEQAAISLSQHVDSLKQLGIRTPSVQSRLYFLQTPEYNAHALIEQEKRRLQQEKEEQGQEKKKRKQKIEPVPPTLLIQAQQNKISMLESWMPSNCAEPAIMTAIYQLYSRPADIYLSVPFEGILSKKGQLLLKYTCTRCALAEPTFMSPDTSSHGQRLTDMRLQKDKPALVSHNLFAAELIPNAENRSYHPYANKRNGIERTIIRNQSHGVGHVKRGHEEVARETTIELKKREALQQSADMLLQADLIPM
jgi:hypothetical protein